MLRKHAQFTPDPTLVVNRKKHKFELVEWWDTKKRPINPVAKKESKLWLISKKLLMIYLV